MRLAILAAVLIAALCGSLLTAEPARAADLPATLECTNFQTGWFDLNGVAVRGSDKVCTDLYWSFLGEPPALERDAGLCAESLIGRGPSVRLTCFHVESMQQVRAATGMLFCSVTEELWGDARRNTLGMVVVRCADAQATARALGY